MEEIKCRGDIRSCEWMRCPKSECGGSFKEMLEEEEKVIWMQGKIRVQNQAELGKGSWDVGRAAAWELQNLDF